MEVIMIRIEDSFVASAQEIELAIQAIETLTITGCNLIAPPSNLTHSGVVRILREKQKTNKWEWENDDEELCREFLVSEIQMIRNH